MTLRTIFAGLVLALLSGCAATAGSGTEGACAAFRAVYISRTDVLTEGTAEQLLAHNRTGAALCGWKPTR